MRVVSIDGLLLEVEPLEGAATDHRDAALIQQMPLSSFGGFPGRAMQAELAPIVRPANAR